MQAESLHYKIWYAEYLWQNQCRTFNKRWEALHRENNRPGKNQDLVDRKAQTFRAHIKWRKKRLLYVTKLAQWQLSLLAILQERYIAA